MMKHFWVVVLALGLVRPLCAQSPPDKPLFRLHTGISIPTAPEGFSDYWKLGFNLGGSLGYPVSPAFSVEGNVAYNKMTFDQSGFLSDLGVTGASVTGAGATVISATANAVGRLQTPGSALAPYFTGGLGLMRLSIGDITATGPGGTAVIEGDSETALLVAFGAGIEIGNGPSTGAFAEAGYSIGFTEGESTQYLPVRVGVVIR